MSSAHAWLTLIGQLGVPALVAALVTFFLNRRLERLRGRRELNTRVFDSARDNVREFARLTSAYWSRNRSDGDVEDETKILLAENDVRVDVAAIVELSPTVDKADIEAAIDDLIESATGGDYQSSERKADIPRIHRIAAAAARLRKALMLSRRRLMEKSVT